MAEMPKGAKPAGMFGSVKAPGMWTGLKVWWKTALVRASQWAANRKATDAELPTGRTVWAASTVLFQPARVPSSVANSSVLGPDLPAEEITKPLAALVATPVGAPVPVPPGPGIVTRSEEPDGSAWPVAS